MDNTDLKDIGILYREVQERMVELENRPEKDNTPGRIKNVKEGRIHELLKIIVRIQQLLLSKIKNKPDKLVEYVDLDYIKVLCDGLSDDERMDLFGNYCNHCGIKNPECQCWNDD